MNAADSSRVNSAGNGFRSARIVSLESRRSQEMAKLIEKHGGIPLVAPSMQEVPLENQTEVFSFLDELKAGHSDVLLLLTGVGTQLLFEVLETRIEASELDRLLSTVQLFCRGPKPLKVLKARRLAARGVAQEPNTWRELLVVLDESGGVQGKRVAIQEYGRPNLELRTALTTRGAVVTEVPIYAWSLPDDTRPLEQAIQALIEGTASAVLFTSARQVDHLLLVAERLGQKDELLAVLTGPVVTASIGPVTTEALLAVGITPSLEPPHPKMGPFVTHVARAFRSLRTET